jgi:predicted ester cyclase
LWRPDARRNISAVEAISELNKRQIRLFVEAVWNQGRLELIDELVAADYRGCFLPLQSRVLGPDGVRQLVSSRRRAYPQLYVKIEDQVAEDDRVVTRWRAGAPDGEPAAGCARRCSGISIIRLLAGKQVDSHTEMNDHRSTR